MGLYLGVFDGNDELEGVEVGSYADFNFFRDAVTATVEQGDPGSVCPTLINHSDCDGEWSSDDARALLLELDKIVEVMRQAPPIELNEEWKVNVAKSVGIKPGTLLECFFDVDGELLVDRLRQLAVVSASTGKPILFQ